MLTMPPPGALLALLAAAWLVGAVAATLIGIRRIAVARRAEADLRATAGILEAAPAVPMLVHPDGRIEASERVGLWLGLARPPRALSDLLQAGFDPEDVDRVEYAFAQTLDTGRPLAEKLVLPGTERTFCFTGGPYAAPEIAPRAVLCWISDISETDRDIERLTRESQRLGSALDGLSTLIEAAPFPMWYRDADLKLALVNGAYVRAVEAEDADEVVRRGMELIEAGGQGVASTMASRALALGEIEAHATPAIIGGQRRMMRITDVPVRDVGVAGFAVDIQELEEARGDLGRFEQAQRDLLDRISAGVAQFGGDQTLVFYNQHFISLFGLEADWLSDHPEFDRVLERMREAERAPEHRDFPSWKAGRRAWFVSAEPVEENWILPGGLHLHVVAQPLPDGGLLLLFEDRTEHLQLASARDTLLRVRTATFDNLYEAIAVFAGDGRLHLWNSRFREIWQLEETALLSHPRVDTLVQSIAPSLADPARAGMIRELVRIATIERQQRSGRIALKDGRHFEFAAVPLPDGNALFTLLDVTASRGIEEALRERNEALEEANGLKTAFVASMSYELRVPLQTIEGFADMLAKGYAGPLSEAATEYIDAIQSAVGKLASLMGDVLDLSQGEVGSLPLALEPVEVAPLINDALYAVAEAAQAAGLALVAKVAADCGTVAGDAKRLRQCIDNLLRNAIAYTPAGGRVLVRGRITNMQSEIVVSDNGRGIPPEQRETIFERFQAPIAVGDDTPQRGFGLALTRQLIQAHGGAVRLDSEVGRGTSVTIELPLSSG